jgi:hypothetical protein
MPCCGNGRARVAAALARSREPRPIPAVRPAPNRPAVVFEYLGQTALAVTGPITRVNYRFPAPGARVPVDASDAGAIAAVPHLRRAIV